MRDLFSDAQKAFLSLFVGVTGPIVVLVILVVCAYCAGKGSGKSDQKLAALTVQKHTTDSVYVVRTDTVTKIQHRVDTLRVVVQHADSAVTIHSDSAVIVHDSVAIIPPEVVTDLRVLRLDNATKDTLIHALYQRDTTQQWRIQTRDQMIRELSHRQLCGRKCALVLGFTAGALLHKVVK